MMHHSGRNLEQSQSPAFTKKFPLVILFLWVLSRCGGFSNRSFKKKVRYHFDFEAACEYISGVTDFVQPDGSVISWWPGPAEKIARPAGLNVGSNVVRAKPSLSDIEPIIRESGWD